MRTVEDIFSSDISFRNDSVEVVAGFLLVSNHLVCLCQSNDERTKAILVIAPHLAKEWQKTIPPLAGTMVAYAGNATIKGRVAKSGIAPLPYVFYEVHRLEFDGPGGIKGVYETTAAV